jgi:polyhydroxyalkanoate synthesis regulator phasin
MPRDDRLKKVSEAGADFLETARAKGEEFLREMTKAGGGTTKQASGAVDDLVTGGRRSTEQFMAAIRKEIASQLSALGLATKEDLADLERRLRDQAGRSAAPAKKAPVPPGSGTAKKTAARTTAEATKTTAQKTSTRKAAVRKTAATKSTS